MKTLVLDYKQIAADRRTDNNRLFRNLWLKIVEAEALLDFVTLGYRIHKQPDGNGWYIHIRDVP